MIRPADPQNMSPQEMFDHLDFAEMIQMANELTPEHQKELLHLVSQGANFFKTTAYLHSVEQNTWPEEN